VSKFFLIILASTLVIQLHAQDSTSSNYPGQSRANKKRTVMNNRLRMEEEGDLIFNRQNVFGIRLASDGYGISYERGIFKTPTRTLLYEFEINEKHSPKEHHVSASNDLANFSSVVPYKLNNLYEVKTAIGQQILIGGKGNKNGVAVSALYAGGLTLGLLKPYYLDISNPSGASSRMTYPQFAADTVFGDGISGASGFTVGWGNLSFKPAVNAKQAMRFDYGKVNSTIGAIEVGVTEEFYASKVPIMYLVPAKQFFFNAYVSILFGNRK
jgi:hypothetical protein